MVSQSEGVDCKHPVTNRKKTSQLLFNTQKRKSQSFLGKKTFCFSVWLKPDTLWAVVLVSREGEEIESWVSVPTFATEVHVPLDCWSTAGEFSSGR